MTTRAGDWLAQASLLRLIAVMALVAAPHVVRLPPWESAAVVAIMLWRAASAMRQWPLPPAWLKVLLSLAAFAGVSASFGRVNGQHAGAALLVMMLALKLTEMRSRRDVLVVVGLCYFVMITHFLFSQEAWTVAYLLACAVAVTALLVEANHANGALSPRITLRMGGALVLQALPLMVLLFVLFPRVPGPLWGLPSDSGAARSGLTDSMAPGDIQRMIQSDEVAFRVRFLDPPPPGHALYWRGPVFTHFDGRRWSALFNGDDYFASYRQRVNDEAYEGTGVELVGGAVRYEMMLEPHRQNWLLALDVPSPRELPPNSVLTGYYQLVTPELVRERISYQTTAWTRFRLSAQLSEGARRNALRLPAEGNPRARALAAGWRSEGIDDEQVVDRALAWLRAGKFVYTLDPPKLGQDMVDEFLFRTRKGFCEHFAGSFTVLMRAAGIPARVVTGYQGGERNDVGDYYVVRQYDAHAWSEVWLPGRGWSRVDPTAIVAPGRLEQGLSGALGDDELPSFARRGRGASSLALLRLQLEVGWDMVTVAWNRWVLAYGPQLQLDFLRRFGIDDWSKMVLALTVLLTATMGVLGALALRRTRPRHAPDRALAAWRRASRRLARRGLVQAPHEGPRDFAQRVARERPDLARAVEALARAYVAARYFGRDEALGELDAAVRALPAR
ncbi:MAG TPA: DUF3488 and transglutaminase-like domain-containing protein [Candidatus Binatia bacterium]|nr:DUF3488 and transglutaminase-like domain-containing protein [Candidatus Binatia bacterium]